MKFIRFFGGIFKILGMATCLLGFSTNFLMGMTEPLSSSTFGSKVELKTMEELFTLTWEGEASHDSTDYDLKIESDFSECHPELVFTFTPKSGEPGDAVVYKVEVSKFFKKPQFKANRGEDVKCWLDDGKFWRKGKLTLNTEESEGEFKISGILDVRNIADALVIDISIPMWVSKKSYTFKVSPTNWKGFWERMRFSNDEDVKEILDGSEDNISFRIDINHIESYLKQVLRASYYKEGIFTRGEDFNSYLEHQGRPENLDYKNFKVSQIKNVLKKAREKLKSSDYEEEWNVVDFHYIDYWNSTFVYRGYGEYQTVGMPDKWYNKNPNTLLIVDGWKELPEDLEIFSEGPVIILPETSGIIVASNSWIYLDGEVWAGSSFDKISGNPIIIGEWPPKKWVQPPPVKDYPFAKRKSIPFGKEVLFID